MTTRDDIKRWRDTGIARGATHLIVVCDTFSHEDYPVYVMPSESASAKATDYNGKNMQRVMEVIPLPAYVKVEV